MPWRYYGHCVGNLSVNDIELNILAEDGVTITFQIIDLVPPTTEDDPTLKHNWHSRNQPQPQCYTVPGQFVQAITPTLAIPDVGKTFWLLDSLELIAFGRDLVQQVNSVTPNASVSKKNSLIPLVKLTREFPYLEASGKY